MGFFNYPQINEVRNSDHIGVIFYGDIISNRSFMFIPSARQCSARGGDLKISLRDDGRVDIAGQAAVVLEGKIRV